MPALRELPPAGPGLVGSRQPLFAVAGPLSLCYLSQGLAIYAIDGAGHAVLDYDSVAETLHLDVPNANLTVGAVTMARGVADLSAVGLRRPRVGQYYLRITGRPTLSFLPITIAIVEGDPVRLHIVQQPSAVAPRDGALEPQPIVDLRDIADNWVLQPPVDTAVAHADVEPGVGGKGKWPHEAAFVDGVFTFRWMEVAAVHGVVYRIVFHMDQQPGFAVANVTSRGIIAEPCPSSSYHAPGQAGCHRCPVGAQCNGTSHLLTQPNHWRKEGAVRFLPCADVNGSEGAPCVGGAEVGTCSRGFTGDLCRQCRPGHTGDACLQCKSGVSGGIVVLWCVMVCLLLGYTIFQAFTSTRKSVPAMAAKMIWTYLQLLRILRPVLPPEVADLFKELGEMSMLHVPDESALCLWSNVGAYTIFTVTMLMPLASLFVALLVLLYEQALTGYQRLQWRGHPRPRHMGYHCWSIAGGRPVWQVLCVCCSVVLYFLYSNLVLQAMDMTNCTEYDYGDPPPGRADRAAEYGLHLFLAVDHRIDCLSGPYQRMRAASITCFFMYGLGIPLSFLVLGLMLKRWGAMFVEEQTLSFLIIGYKAEYRYWELLNMLRKLCIILVVTMVPDLLLRLYLCIWVLIVFLALHYVFQPFNTSLGNYLEAAGFLVLTLSLNLAILWSHPYFVPAHAQYVAALEITFRVLVITMQVCLLLGFVAVALVGLREPLTEALVCVALRLGWGRVATLVRAATNSTNDSGTRRRASRASHASDPGVLLDSRASFASTIGPDVAICTELRHSEAEASVVFTASTPLIPLLGAPLDASPATTSSTGGARDAAGDAADDMQPTLLGRPGDPEPLIAMAPVPSEPAPGPRPDCSTPALDVASDLPDCNSPTFFDRMLTMTGTLSPTSSADREPTREFSMIEVRGGDLASLTSPAEVQGEACRTTSGHSVAGAGAAAPTPTSPASPMPAVPPVPNIVAVMPADVPPGGPGQPEAPCAPQPRGSPRPPASRASSSSPEPRERPLSGSGPRIPQVPTLPTPSQRRPPCHAQPWAPINPPPSPKPATRSPCKAPAAEGPARTPPLSPEAQRHAPADAEAMVRPRKPGARAPSPDSAARSPPKSLPLGGRVVGPQSQNPSRSPVRAIRGPAEPVALGMRIPKILSPRRPLTERAREASTPKLRTLRTRVVQPEDQLRLPNLLRYDSDPLQTSDAPLAEAPAPAYSVARSTGMSLALGDGPESLVLMSGRNPGSVHIPEPALQRQRTWSLPISDQSSKESQVAGSIRIAKRDSDPFEITRDSSAGNLIASQLYLQKQAAFTSPEPSRRGGGFVRTGLGFL